MRISLCQCVLLYARHRVLVHRRMHACPAPRATSCLATSCLPPLVPPLLVLPPRVLPPLVLPPRVSPSRVPPPLVPTPLERSRRTSHIIASVALESAQQLSLLPCSELCGRLPGKLLYCQLQLLLWPVTRKAAVLSVTTVLMAGYKESCCTVSYNCSYGRTGTLPSTVVLNISVPIVFFPISAAPLPHSEHRFPAPSSKLWQIWLRHRRRTLYLRVAVHRRGQRPPKGLGTNMTVEAT